MIVGSFGRAQAGSCCCSSDGAHEIADVFRCLTTVDFVHNYRHCLYRTRAKERVKSAPKSNGVARFCCKEGDVFLFAHIAFLSELLWNRLPASIVLAENIHLFKKLLRQVNFSYAMFGKD